MGHVLSVGPRRTACVASIVDIRQEEIVQAGEAAGTALGAREAVTCAR